MHQQKLMQGTYTLGTGKSHDKDDRDKVEQLHRETQDPTLKRALQQYLAASNGKDDSQQSKRLKMQDMFPTTLSQPAVQTGNLDNILPTGPVHGHIVAKAKGEAKDKAVPKTMSQSSTAHTATPGWHTTEESAANGWTIIHKIKYADDGKQIDAYKRWRSPPPEHKEYREKAKAKQHKLVGFTEP